MSWLKHFNCSLSHMPVTCKGCDILAHLFFLHIHLCFDSLFNRELENSRTMLAPFGIAIRATEMISIIFLISTLSRTEICKKGWPAFCSRPAVPVQHSQLYHCNSAVLTGNKQHSHVEHLLYILGNCRLHDPDQFTYTGKHEKIHCCRNYKFWLLNHRNFHDRSHILKELRKFSSVLWGCKSSHHINVWFCPMTVFSDFPFYSSSTMSLHLIWQLYYSPLKSFYYSSSLATENIRKRKPANKDLEGNKFATSGIFHFI